MFALLYFCQGNFSKFLIFFTYFRGDFFFLHVKPCEFFSLGGFIFMCETDSRKHFCGKKNYKKSYVLQQRYNILLLKQAFQLVSHFSHTIFFNWQKKSCMKSMIPGESFGEICFLELYIFFSSRPKKGKEKPFLVSHKQKKISS